MIRGALLLVIVVSAPARRASAAAWPVQDANKRISGVYGDYRDLSAPERKPSDPLFFFHDGIDIQKFPVATQEDAVGDSVNTIGIGGIISVFGGRDPANPDNPEDFNRNVLITATNGKTYGYGHIDLVGRTIDDRVPDQPIVLGRMNPHFPPGPRAVGPHLHFAVYETTTMLPVANPLNTEVLGALPSASDTTPPAVSTVLFVRDDLSAARGDVSGDQSVLYGKVDVIAQAHDDHGGRDSLGTPLLSGIWRIGYYVKDSDGEFLLNLGTFANPLFLLFDEFSGRLDRGVDNAPNDNLLIYA